MQGVKKPISEKEIKSILRIELFFIFLQYGERAGENFKLSPKFYGILKII